MEKQFKKLASEHTAIDFVNQLSETPELNILTYLYYYNGGGVIVDGFYTNALIKQRFRKNLMPTEISLIKEALIFQKPSNRHKLKIITKGPRTQLMLI